MELPIAAAWFALGKLRSEEAIDAAHLALQREIQSDSLIQLISIEPQWSEVGSKFAQALRELGVPIPSAGEAVRILALHFANQILTGEVSPYQGARRIWELTWEQDCPSSLMRFVGLASEWEDRPDVQTKLEADIVEEARRLVAYGLD